MSILKIILLGPPASGKSTLAAAAPLLYPRHVVAFDMEGIGPKTKGLSEQEMRNAMLPVQRALFGTLHRTTFNQSFVLSPGFVNHDQMIPGGWWKVFLLPHAKEHYYEAVKKRNPNERQKCEGHYDFSTKMWEKCKDDGRSIRVSRIDRQGNEVSIPDTWSAILAQLGVRWTVDEAVATMLSRR